VQFKGRDSLGTAAPLEFLEALGIEGPNLTHPSRRPFCEFQVVFMFRGALGFTQSIALLLDLDISTRGCGDEGTTAALADKLVNFGDDISWQDDMRSLVQSLWHTSSVT
jgi:hypothetical protein